MKAVAVKKKDMAKAAAGPTDHPAAEQDRLVGAQLRALRRARGLSLEQLSAKADLSIGTISQIERGISSPSIRALRSLAESLGVTVAWFFQGSMTTAPEEIGMIVRKANRKELSFDDGGVNKYLLTPDLEGKIELLLVEIAPLSSSGEEYYTHEGEEAGLVIEGAMDLYVEGKHYALQEGDAFRFASTRPHRFANPLNRISRVIWSITPPSY